MINSPDQPRAPRYSLHFPVRYRAEGENDWRTGVTENISRSGLLFRAEHMVETNTRLEMVFSLPLASIKESPAEITCHAEIVRLVPPHETEPTATVGARILNYRFHRTQMEAA